MVDPGLLRSGNGGRGQVCTVVVRVVVMIVGVVVVVIWVVLVLVWCWW